MSNKNIIFTAIGDLCIDHYINEEKYFLGGCAFNTAYYSTLLDAKSNIISSIGKDKFGATFLLNCKKLNINIEFIKVENTKKTSTINVLLSDNNPEYFNLNVEIIEKRKLRLSEKEFLKTSEIAHSILFKSTEKIFSDFCSLKLPQTLKSGDFSGIYEYSLALDAIEKYGLGLDIIIKSLEINNKKEIKFLRNFANKNNKLVLILLGKNGSLVFYKNKIYQQKIIKSQVIDTSGAGDAYISAFLNKYKMSNNIEQAMLKGTQMAAKIVSELGASPMEINIS